MLADVAYSEWQEGAKYGSISDTASILRYQLPNCSALMNLRKIRIISRYCIHKLALGSFANVSTWPSRMAWILAMASPLPRRPLSWPSARHTATRQLSDLSWYTVSCLMIRRRLAQPRLRCDSCMANDFHHSCSVFNILEQVICTCSGAFIVRIYVRWSHQCAYNDMNYHIASRGLFHGGHVAFTPSWTQRTDKIRLPSYSLYQKTYM